MKLRFDVRTIIHRMTGARLTNVVVVSIAAIDEPRISKSTRLVHVHAISLRQLRFACSPTLVIYLQIVTFSKTNNS